MTPNDQRMTLSLTHSTVVGSGFETLHIPDDIARDEILGSGICARAPQALACTLR